MQVARWLKEKLDTLSGCEPSNGTVIKEIDSEYFVKWRLEKGIEGDVIWVTPVHCWGIPPYVLEAIDKTSFSQAQTHAPCNSATGQTRQPVHHLVLTCGDDAGYADRMWLKAIEKKGISAGITATVIMPNNYVCMKGFDVDPEQVADQKIETATGTIPTIAQAILQYCNGMLPTTPLPFKHGSYPWIKTYIIRPWFLRHKMSPAPFRYTDACVECGKCQRVCPTHNITGINGGVRYSHPDLPSAYLSPGNPQWGKNCTMCLACYHHCPVHAIEYGNKTCGKGQYYYGRQQQATQE